MVYHSKKDAWLVALVGSAILLPTVWGIYNLITPGGDRQAGWTSLLAGTFTGAAVLWLTYPLYYEITESELVIRSGMMRREIPLLAIEEVRPTRNPLSAPAWSLDRLRVNYKRGGEERFALISPADKHGFMHELVEREAGLEMRGGRVVRVS